MCDQEQFNFSDLNLDFLDWTPLQPAPGAPKAMKCSSSPSTNDEHTPVEPISETQKSVKIKNLAKRIANIDNLVLQIKELQKERTGLKQQLKEFQVSATEIRKLYEEEKQERQKLQRISNDLRTNCTALSSELAHKNLCCDQLQSQVEEARRGPLEYDELVVHFLRLSSKLDEERQLHWSSQCVAEKIKKYCIENSLAVPEKRSPKKRPTKITKSEIGIQCEIWSTKPHSTADIKPVDKKETRTQGTQHISTTTTRSTSTSSFIQKHNVGTSFPEQTPLPAFDDMLKEMLNWEVEPMSPLCDVDPPAISRKSTGTCTLLCNIQKPIDFIGSQALIASIKRSNSRPPSRNMLENIKNETMTPPPIPPSNTSHTETQNTFSQFASLNSNTFEDLWQVFGQMVYSLLKNRCDVNTIRPSATGDALSQQQFQHWLRSIYDDLPLPATVPGAEEQSIDRDCIKHSQQSRPSHQSIGTSPIRLSSDSRIFENNCLHSKDETIYQPIATNSFNFPNPNLNASSLEEVHKILLPTSGIHTNKSAFQAPSKNLLKMKRSENKKAKSLHDHSLVVNEILKLFPASECTYETRMKIMKLLETKRKLSKKPKSSKMEEDESQTRDITENAVEFLSTFEDFARKNTENHIKLDKESLNKQHESIADHDFANASDRIFRKPIQYVKSRKSKAQLNNLFDSDEEMNFDSEAEIYGNKKSHDLNDSFGDTISDNNNSNTDVEVCKKNEEIYFNSEAEIYSCTETNDSFGHIKLKKSATSNIKMCKRNELCVNANETKSGENILIETCENKTNHKIKLGETQIDHDENHKSVAEDTIFDSVDESNLIIDESSIQISTLHTNTHCKSIMQNENGTCASIEITRNDSIDEPENSRIDKSLTKPYRRTENQFNKKITDDVKGRKVSCSSTEQFEDYLEQILTEVTPRSLSPISLIDSIAPTENIIIPEPTADRLSVKSVPKTRGCKRKLENQSASAAVIVCKRSERLRAKQRTAGLKVIPPLPPSVKLGKYTTKRRSTHIILNETKENNTAASYVENDDPISLEVTMGFFRERNELSDDKSDIEDENSKRMVKKVNDLISVEKRTTNEPLANKCFEQLMETNCTPSKDVGNTSFNKIDNVPYLKTIPEQTTLHLPDASVPKNHIENYYSPASPPHIDSSFEDLNTTTLHIPLDVDINHYSQQNYSLLHKMISGYNNSFHKSMVEIHLKSTSSHKNVTELKVIINNFLDNSDTDPESACLVLLQKMKAVTNDTSEILLAIVLQIQEVPRPEQELNCPVENVPPKYLGKRHRKISFVMRSLQEAYPHFYNELMALIEKTLFNFNTSEKITLASALNLTQLYLLTISNQLPNMKTNPARLFIAKCLYYYNLKAIPMVYEVLCCFPTTLPHREERAYDRSDPLINVIIHILMSTKYDMDKADLRTKELLSKLRFEYHFEPFKPERSEVLTNLIEKIKSGNIENVSYTFALFCKRLPQQKAENEILKAHLIPLANEFYQIALNSISHDKHISCLIETISMIIKPFSVDTNISIYLSIFSRFLNAIDRQIVQESAVQAIIRCQRFGYVNCYTELSNFKPNYDLKPLTKAMFQTFIYRKPLKFWKTLKLQSSQSIEV